MIGDLRLEISDLRWNVGAVEAVAGDIVGHAGGNETGDGPAFADAPADVGGADGDEGGGDADDIRVRSARRPRPSAKPTRRAECGVRNGRRSRRFAPARLGLISGR